jgi:hypothetical protein
LEVPHRRGGGAYDRGVGHRPWSCPRACSYDDMPAVAADAMCTCGTVAICASAEGRHGPRADRRVWPRAREARGAPPRVIAEAMRALRGPKEGIGAWRGGRDGDGFAASGGAIPCQHFRNQRVLGSKSRYMSRCWLPRDSCAPRPKKPLRHRASEKIRRLRA